uniref:Uncharacterized protein n=1 Tax=Oryza barthii TaxID=65489 RepID=A0A0D3F8T5_9ORYZ
MAAASVEQAGSSPRLSSLLPPAAIGSRSSSQRRCAPFILTGAERRWPGGTLPPAAYGAAHPRDGVARGGVRLLAARGTTPCDGCGRGGAAVAGGAHPPAARGTVHPRGGDARNGASGTAMTALHRRLAPPAALRPDATTGPLRLIPDSALRRRSPTVLPDGALRPRPAAGAPPRRTSSASPWPTARLRELRSSFQMGRACQAGLLWINPIPIRIGISLPKVP